MKKLLLGLGTIAVVVAPVASVVACSKIDDWDTTKKLFNVLHDEGWTLKMATQNKWDGEMRVILKNGKEIKQLNFTGDVLGGAKMIQEYWMYLENKKGK